MFRQNDRAGPIQILNLRRLRDGRMTTGEAAYAAYSRLSEPVLARLGAKMLEGTF